MTREEVERVIENIRPYYPWKHEVNYLKDHYDEQRAEIEGYKRMIQLQDGEIEDLKAEIARLNGDVTALDSVCQSHEKIEADLVKQYDTLMAQAVKFAEYTEHIVMDIFEGNITKAEGRPIFVSARDFLNSPEVQAWRKRQEEAK